MDQWLSNDTFGAPDLTCRHTASSTPTNHAGATSPATRGSERDRAVTRLREKVGRRDA